MNAHDRAFERLRRANPALVTVIEDRRTGREMLAIARDAAAATSHVVPRRVISWRRGALVAAAAAIVVLLVALPLLFTSSDGVPVTTVTPTTIEEQGFLDSPLFELIEPGRYVVDAVGTTFEIDITGEWALQRNGGGHVVFTHPVSVGPSDRDVVFFRPTALVDPRSPGTGVMGWPLDDIEGWLANLEFDGTVSEPVETTLGGLTAVRFDIETAAGIAFAESGEAAALDIPPDILHRIWWIGQGELDPIIVLVGAGSDGEPWFDAAATVLDTVRFGEPRPHPLEASMRPWEQGLSSTLPAGTIRLPAAGGIEFVIDSSHELGGVSAGGTASIDIDGAREVGVFIAAQTAEGDVVTSIDDAVAAIEAVATVVASTDVAVAGSPGRVIDVVDGPLTDVDVLRAGTDAGELDEWTAPVSGRIWLVDSPRGVLVISAGTASQFLDADEAIDVGQQIADSLRLIDGRALGLITSGS